MIKLKKEQTKTTLLVILILTSMIQVGIHWSQQAQGFPFRFLASLFSKNIPEDYVDENSLKGIYFEPESITVAISPFSQWKLTDEHKDYKLLWNDIRWNYLPAIFEIKPKSVFPADYWGELLNKTGIRIDFPVSYPKEVILWNEDINTQENSGFTGIRSILIQPYEDVNETINIVYVYDDEMVYMYRVQISANSLPKEYYRSLSEDLKRQPYIQPMRAIGIAFPELTLNPDIPVYTDEFYKAMQTLSIDIPESIRINENIFNSEDVQAYNSFSNMQKVPDIESIQESILLSQKDSLMASIEKNPVTAVFSDTENIYRLDSNGLLRYKFLPANSDEAGSIKTAFINAISFIELRKKLLNNVDIVLSSIEPVKNGYKFSFDYSIDSIRVQIRETQNNELITYSPIVITASESRVLECNWAIRRFTQNNDHKLYNISFSQLFRNNDFADRIMVRGELFEAIDKRYFIDIDKNMVSTLLPDWIVKTDKGSYFIPLSEEAE